MPRHLTEITERKKEVRPEAWIGKPSRRCEAWGGAAVKQKGSTSLNVKSMIASVPRHAVQPCSPVHFSEVVYENDFRQVAPPPPVAPAASTGKGSKAAVTIAVTAHQGGQVQSDGHEGRPTSPTSTCSHYRKGSKAAVTFAVTGHQVGQADGQVGSSRWPHRPQLHLQRP